MTAPQQALLASMRGGRVWVPYSTADEVVAQLEAQGCEVVRAWIDVVTWSCCEGGAGVESSDLSVSAR